MSVKHPIIAITGSSGAGTTSVTRTFEHIFRREDVNAAIVEGDSFHRYDRAEMKAAMAEAEARRRPHFSHFGPEANLFAELEALFRGYGETGTGQRRKYLHDDEEAAPYRQEPGTFTPWEDAAAEHRPAVLRRPARRASSPTTSTSRARRPADRRGAGHQPRMDPEAPPRQDARAATRPRR